MALTLDQLVAQSGAKGSSMSLDDLVAGSRPTAASMKAVSDAKAAAVAPVKTAATPSVDFSQKPAPGFSTPFATNSAAAVKSVGQQIKDAAVGSFNTAVGGVNKIREGGTPVEGLQAGIDVERGIGGVIFSPLAPALSGIGALINKAGEALSNSPTFNQNDIANDPNNPEVKALNIFSGLGEIAMAILGAKGGEIKPRTAVGEAPARSAEVPRTSEAPVVSPIQVKPRTGTTPHAEYAKSMGYEPIKPNNELPTIDFGNKSGRVPSTLPTIQAGGKTPVGGAPLPAGARLVPEKGVQGPTSTLPPLEPVKTTARASTNVKPIEGTGATKVRGLSEHVEANAIEKKLTDTLGDLPEYKQVSMKDQAQRAAEIINSDPEYARAIAMGEKAPPKGVLPESVFVAAEHDAVTRGDVQMITDLANSKLTSAATTMGQRIRTLGERDSNSPIQAIKEIQQARAEAIARRSASETPETVVKRAQSSIRRANTPQSWGDFIKALEC